MATDDVDIPDKADTPIEREAFRRAEGDEGEAQRILFELREQGWTPEQEQQFRTGSPPSGSETIQGRGARNGGSDRSRESPVEQTTDQEGMRPPTGGPPGSSETIPDDGQTDGQPRESASDPAQRPSDEELEGVNLNELSAEEAQELIGEEITQEQFQGEFATSIGQDEQRRATGSPVRPTDPQFEEEASLSQLASAVNNPTIELSGTGRTRLAQQSPVELAALGLSGGEIRSISPAIDTSDDLQREENFRQTFTEEEAQEYLQERSQEMRELRNRPGATERRATEEEQEQLESIEQAAAQAFDEQLGIDVGAGDVNLQRTEEGIQPTLRPGKQRDVQQEQLTEAREAIASRLDQRTDTDVTPEDVEIDFASETAGVDEQTESEIMQERREEAAANIRQQATVQTQRTGIGALETTGGGIAASSILANVTAEDIEQRDGELALDTDIQRQVGAARFGVDPDDVIVDDGKIRLTEEFQREQTREQFTEATQQREEAFAEGRAAIERGLEQQLPSLTGQEVRGGRGGRGTAVGGGDLDLTEEDIERTQTGLRLTESGREQFQETQLEAATEVIDEQLPIAVSEEDVTREDGAVTLSEQGQEELREFQEQEATEQLLADLRSETGVSELDEGDISVSREETDDGVTFSAQLTRSGQKELAGEQTPGSDLPLVGGFFESGGETAAGIEQGASDIGEGITDRLPETPEIELPDIDSEEISAAAAGGVAVPEPVTSGTGALVLGTLSASALTVSAAQRSGIGQGPPSAGGSTRIDEEGGELPVQEAIQETTEVTIPSTSEFFRAEQETPQDGGQTTTEVGGGTGITKTEIGIPDQTGTADPRVLTTTQLVSQRLEEEEEDDELGVPDDPFLESDRRLRDPRREFGQPEDISRSVDPTTEESESQRDIQGGIGGVGEPEPAREGAESFEENFQQYLEEIREDAERQEVFEREELLDAEKEETAIEDILEGVETAQQTEARVGEEGQTVTETTGELDRPFSGVIDRSDADSDARGQTDAQEDISERVDTRQQETIEGQQIGEAATTQFNEVDTAAEQLTQTEEVVTEATAAAFDFPFRFEQEFGQPDLPFRTVDTPTDEPPRRPPGIDLPEFDPDQPKRERRFPSLAAGEFDNPVLGPNQAFEFDPFEG